ncbi:methyltransferase domain-containing protein [Paenibacillus chartarius]|uniref:Methyltransferase domain-containing protein n=1 Tax=Paenibacillus chartarius TaxID=747481 RepID=A0ABV6DTC4_9BACL
MSGRFLQERELRPELMDDEAAGGPALVQAHRHLRRLNRLFAAARPSLYGVEKLWLAAGRPRALTVTDIGCGSGDVNRRLLRWAEKRNVVLRLILTDVAEEACAEARRLFAGVARVDVRQCDVFELPQDSSDIVTASQMLHHFGSGSLVAAVERMLQASRLGVVIADIHRHPVAWSAVWLVTRLSPNRYIRHDGPLSVAKGFRAADWDDLRDRLNEQLGGELELEYRWMPLFRYAVTLRPNRRKLDD